MSHVMCQIFLNFFIWQIGEAIQGRVCYQWGLPRLVLICLKFVDCFKPPLRFMTDICIDGSTYSQNYVVGISLNTAFICKACFPSYMPDAHTTKSTARALIMFVPFGHIMMFLRAQSDYKKISIFKKRIYYSLRRFTTCQCFFLFFFVIVSLV